MKAFLSSWWKQCKAHPVISFIVVATIAAVVWIILAGGINGTGFNGSNQITTSKIISGPSKGTITQTEVYQQGKTLWDWLQLLIVPAVLAIGGALISMGVSKTEQDAATQRDKTERELAQDNQHETSLQDFIDKMSYLLLEKDLRNSNPGNEIRKIARVRTLTILSRLNPERKKSLLQFLYEAGLISKKNSIVLLAEADLRGADLFGFNLFEADLSGADLSGAMLAGANLSGANLSMANLSKADLSGAMLVGANLIGAMLSNTKLSMANLKEADLREADLFEADLKRADFIGANLSGVNLSGADLRKTDLSAADLSNAYLYKADLRGADLRGADLFEADLSAAIFKKDQLDKGQLDKAKQEI